MRYKISALVVAIAAALAAAIAPVRTTSAPSPPRGMQDEEGLTRGAFFDTRPEVQSPKPKRPKPVIKSNRPTNSTAKTNPAPPPPPPVAGPNQGVNTAKPPAFQGGQSAPAAVVPARLGLGYTLFMRDPAGKAVRVDPAREFVTGEGIRLVIEPNTDGYLYIFHTENGTNEKMLYPDARLDCGQNRISAHLLHQIPQDVKRWFDFTGGPAAERLYVVVARAPLADVPTGEALLEYCEEVEGDCEWKPTPAVWAWIQKKAATEPVLVSRSEETLGKTESAGESEARTRGLTLSKNDPAPAVIRLNASPSAGVHLTTINLVHK